MGEGRARLEPGLSPGPRVTRVLASESAAAFPTEYDHVQQTGSCPGWGGLCGRRRPGPGDVGRGTGDALPRLRVLRAVLLRPVLPGGVLPAGVRGACDGLRREPGPARHRV